MRTSVFVWSICFAAQTLFGQCNPIELEKKAATDAAADDHFGERVSIDGVHAIVGAKLNDDAGPSTGSGSAYIFRFNGSNWIELQKVVGSDTAAFDNFGNSVGISGSRAVVGARGADVLGTDVGAAYVFADGGPSWAQEAKLLANDGTLFDEFGTAVAISGDTIVVGSPNDDDLGSASGSVYVFVRTGTSWNQQAKLVASDGAAFDAFGSAVAISGNRVIVGAPLDDHAAVDVGSVYFFERTGTNWVQVYKGLGPSPAAQDEMGSSVAISGGRAVAGIPKRDFLGINSGVARTFSWDGITWTASQELWGSNSSNGDLFAYSVSISDERLLIGIPNDDSLLAANSGVVAMYRWNGEQWSSYATLYATDGSTNDFFGGAVCVSGERAVVGALADSPAGLESGSAYFELLPEQLTVTRDPQSGNENAGQQSAAFSVLHTGTPPFDYYWYHDGQAVANGASLGGGSVSGANSNAMIIANPGALDAGEYYCLVADACSIYFSERATLTIDVPTPPLAGDADGNCVVNFADITQVLAAFGATCQ